MHHFSLPSQDMATLRDYVAYTRTYLHPSLSEEAGQTLVQAYVGEGEGLVAGGKERSVVMIQETDVIFSCYFHIPRHAEDRQCTWCSDSLPSAAGISHPIGRSPCQDEVLRRGGDCGCGGSQEVRKSGHVLCFAAVEYSISHGNPRL